MKMAFLLPLATVWLCGCKSEPMANRHWPEVAVLDLENRMVNPFEDQKAKAIVFVFVRTDCPISNRYAPEIERLTARYVSQGIAFWLVYPEPSTSIKEIEQHRKDYRLSLQALRDPRHALVKMARVKVTPEAAVFLPDGHELYRGRIDDRNVDYGKERPAPTTHDLDEALSSVIGGKPIASSVTRAVGCYIEQGSKMSQAPLKNRSIRQPGATRESPPVPCPLFLRKRGGLIRILTSFANCAAGNRGCYFFLKENPKDAEAPDCYRTVVTDDHQMTSFLAAMSLPGTG